MHFKNPEILYFLLLLIIPILVHLFQLRRFKKEYFTNVAFLKSLEIQTRKSSKIKKWLLLLTRLLLLAFLIFAFAQPFIKAKEDTQVSNELFIVLDNSHSMQARGAKGELLRRSIQDLLTHVPEDKIFTLLTLDDVFQNTDIRSVQKTLQELPYSPRSFDLDQILSRVQMQKTNINKDVLVITDGIALDPEILAQKKEGIQLSFIQPKGEQKSNLAIDSVYITKSLDNFYEIAVRIRAYGDINQTLPVAIHKGNQQIAKTQAKIENEVETMFFNLPKEHFQGTVSIEDNALTYDNQWYFSISEKPLWNVLAITEKENTDYLSRIFTEEFTFQFANISNLDYNILAQQDVVILNEISNIPEALQNTLKTLIAQGLQLVFIPNENITPENINIFLNYFGNIQFKKNQETDKLITKINFDHPLYQGVFEKKATNFQYPKSKAFFEIQTFLPHILMYEDQSPFLVNIPMALGNIYVFANPINKQQSNFQNSPLIVPTFYNMGQNITASGKLSHIIGSNATMVIDMESQKETVLTVSNDHLSFIPMQQWMQNKVKLTFSELPQTAGNYQIKKENTDLKPISFNYARTESDLTSQNITLLQNENVFLSVEDFFETITAARTPNPLWKWFLMAVILLLLIELGIQKFLK